MAHRWTYEEDYICAKACVRYKEEEFVNIYDLLRYLSVRLPNISSGSIRMKIQNIKGVCSAYQLPNKLDVSSLDQYSQQCKRAVFAAMCDAGRI